MGLVSSVEVGEGPWEVVARTHISEARCGAPRQTAQDDNPRKFVPRFPCLRIETWGTQRVLIGVGVPVEWRGCVLELEVRAWARGAGCCVGISDLAQPLSFTPAV